MILQPVLIPIPEDNSLKGPQKVARQREYARRALALCAKLCEVNVTEWRQDDNRVPQVSDGYYWSIAHKPRWVAAVISDQPVGIDIEHIKPRGHEGLWERLADEQEWQLAGERSWQMFFRLWTAKEATLKANGMGIGGFSQCRIVQVLDERHLVLTFNGRKWPIEQYVVADHLAAITSDQEKAVWHVQQG